MAAIDSLAYQASASAAPATYSPSLSTLVSGAPSLASATASFNTLFVDNVTYYSKVKLPGGGPPPPPNPSGFAFGTVQLSTPNAGGYYTNTLGPDPKLDASNVFILTPVNNDPTVQTPTLLAPAGGSITPTAPSFPGAAIANLVTSPGAGVEIVIPEGAVTCSVATLVPQAPVTTNPVSIWCFMCGMGQYAPGAGPGGSGGTWTVCGPENTILNFCLINPYVAP